MNTNRSLAWIPYNEAKRVEMWQEGRFPEQARLWQSVSLPAECPVPDSGARGVLLRSTGPPLPACPPPFWKEWNYDHSLLSWGPDINVHTHLEHWSHSTCWWRNEWIKEWWFLSAACHSWGNSLPVTHPQDSPPGLRALPPGPWVPSACYRILWDTGSSGLPPMALPTSLPEAWGGGGARVWLSLKL